MLTKTKKLFIYLIIPKNKRRIKSPPLANSAIRDKVIGVQLEINNKGDLYANLPYYSLKVKRIVMASHADSVKMALTMTHTRCHIRYGSI